MRSKVYGSVPEDLATRLYEHFGGVARYVLGVPSVAKPTAGLDSLLLPLTKALEASSPAQVGEMCPLFHELVCEITQGRER